MNWEFVLQLANSIIITAAALISGLWYFGRWGRSQETSVERIADLVQQRNGLRHEQYTTWLERIDGEVERLRDHAEEIAGVPALLAAVDKHLNSIDKRLDTIERVGLHSPATCPVGQQLRLRGVLPDMPAGQ